MSTLRNGVVAGDRAASRKRNATSRRCVATSVKANSTVYSEAAPAFHSTSHRGPSHHSSPQLPTGSIAELVAPSRRRRPDRRGGRMGGIRGLHGDSERALPGRSGANPAAAERQPAARDRPAQARGCSCADQCVARGGGPPPRLRPARRERLRDHHARCRGASRRGHRHPGVATLLPVVASDRDPHAAAPSREPDICCRADSIPIQREHSDTPSALMWDSTVGYPVRAAWSSGSSSGS
jgi:hypothetical protein